MILFAFADRLIVLKCDSKVFQLIEMFFTFAYSFWNFKIDEIRKKNQEEIFKSLTQQTDFANAVVT